MSILGSTTVNCNSILPIGGVPSGASGGGIIQCVQTTVTATDSTTSESYTDVGGMSATITPRSSSNKILVVMTIGSQGSQTTPRPLMYRVLRGSTAIGQGITDRGGSCSFSSVNYTAGYVAGGYTWTFLDTPATTSATTYKLQWKTYSSTIYFNRGNENGTGSYNVNGSSRVLLMEVSG